MCVCVRARRERSQRASCLVGKRERPPEPPQPPPPPPSHQHHHHRRMHASFLLEQAPPRALFFLQCRPRWCARYCFAGNVTAQPNFWTTGGGQWNYDRKFDGYLVASATDAGYLRPCCGTQGHYAAEASFLERGRGVGGEEWAGWGRGENDLERPFRGRFTALLPGRLTTTQLSLPTPFFPLDHPHLTHTPSASAVLLH